MIGVDYRLQPGAIGRSIKRLSESVPGGLGLLVHQQLAFQLERQLMAVDDGLVRQRGADYIAHRIFAVEREWRKRADLVDVHDVPAVDRVVDHRALLERRRWTRDQPGRGSPLLLGSPAYARNRREQSS